MGQLAEMSLAELAATLRLPPARLASMTLTQLALRLAELNSRAASATNDDAADDDQAPPPPSPATPTNSVTLFAQF